jgi:hypothetical protein
LFCELRVDGVLRSPGIEKACFSVGRRSAGALVAPVTLEAPQGK